MSQSNSRIRFWLRTIDGKLIFITVLLAAIAFVAYSFETIRDAQHKADVQESMRKQSTLQSKMMRDLRSGMKHDAFVLKYGKADSLERRDDGLFRLHYEDVNVTFDRSGTPIEIIQNGDRTGYGR